MLTLMSLLVLTVGGGLLGDAPISEVGGSMLGAQRSARLLTQADVPPPMPMPPAPNAAYRISELDSRIQLLEKSRQGMGGPITGIVGGSLLALGGTPVFILGLMILEAAGAATLTIGGAMILGGIALIIWCASSIGSRTNHNAEVAAQVSALKGEREQLQRQLQRPVSSRADWAPAGAVTLARF